MWAAFAPWLLLATPAFALWSTSGLESAAFTAAAAASLLFVPRGRIGTVALVASIATLIRPEGALLAATAFGTLLWQRAAERRRVLAYAALYGGLLGALTLFRLSYFGAPLPNTFYAKVGGTGAWGLIDGARFAVQLLIPALAGIAFVVRERWATFGSIWFGVVVVYVIAVGGDVFPNSRFFLPVLPVVCAHTVRGALRASRGTTAFLRLVAVSIPVCLAWYVFGVLVGAGTLGVAVLGTWAFRNLRLSLCAVGAASLALSMLWPVVLRAHHPQNGILRLASETRAEALESNRRINLFTQRLGQDMAAQLNERMTGEGSPELIAAPAIGAIGYYCRAPVLDILGLVTPKVARSFSASPRRRRFFPGHQRSNARYVLSRKPRFLLIPEKNSHTFPLPAVHDLWEHPLLTKRYTWVPSIPAYARARKR